MDAAFNAMKKIIFGEHRKMYKKYKLMKDEIFLEKNHDTSDGRMAKKLLSATS